MNSEKSTVSTSEIEMHPSFKKGMATAILHTAARTLRKEGMEELAVAIELLLVAVTASDDPRTLSATVRNKPLF